MIGRIPFISGDEWDALSRRSKGLLSWRRGERRKIKRGYRRRERRLGRKALREHPG